MELSKEDVLDRLVELQCGITKDQDAYLTFLRGEDKKERAKIMARYCTCLDHLALAVAVQRAIIGGASFTPVWNDEEDLVKLTVEHDQFTLKIDF